MKRFLPPIGAALLIIAAMSSTSKADDHADAPALANSAKVGPTDLAGLYVFRSPTNANNTVFIITASPFADFYGRETFQPGISYDIVIDHGGQGYDTLVLRTTFGAKTRTGTQTFRLTLQRPGEVPVRLLTGTTRQNVPIPSGGMFRASLFDDPFFFDQTGFEAHLNGASFPRSAGQARNYFGPTANVLGIVIELPSNQVVGRFSNLIGVHGRVMKGRKQIDRVGRPLINKLLIPPVPRGSNFPNPPSDLRNAYNRARPAFDFQTFGEAMIGVMGGFYGTPFETQAFFVTAAFPDQLVFEAGNPNGFGTVVANHLGNGRRLRDDVGDFMLNLVTGGGITTDNIPDDNGNRITDGAQGSVAAFPYIGSPTQDGSGPNGG